jgi:hypothetical protein
MTTCEKPVSELTLGEAANCAWETVKGAVVSVFSHPGSATITEWTITVFAGLAVLYILSLLIFRR